MARIESHPLPPPGHPATTITEADRAEIISQANDVIDYYLNGLGFFAVEGVRKPPSDEPGYDSTVQDLTKFKSSIVNARQFVDDQSGILNSVVELIERTIKQVQHAADAGKFGFRDNITVPAPATPDSINSARVPLPPGSTDPFAPKDPLSSSPGGDLQQIGRQSLFGAQGGTSDNSMALGGQLPPARSRPQAPARPAPPADPSLSPLHSAPETPRSFGPFAVPGPLRSDAFGVPRVSPEATLPAVLRTGPIGDSQGIRDLRDGAALAPPSNLAPTLFRSSIRGTAQPDPSSSALLPGPDMRAGSARGRPSFRPVRFPLEALLVPDRNRALDQWASSSLRRDAPPPTQRASAGPASPDAPIAQGDPSNLDWPPAGGLLGMIREYMRHLGH